MKKEVKLQLALNIFRSNLMKIAINKKHNEELIEKLEERMKVSSKDY
jgi:hypothetical protein